MYFILVLAALILFCRSLVSSSILLSYSDTIALIPPGPHPSRNAYTPDRTAYKHPWLPHPDLLELTQRTPQLNHETTKYLHYCVYRPRVHPCHLRLRVPRQQTYHLPRSAVMTLLPMDAEIWMVIRTPPTNHQRDIKTSLHTAKLIARR